MHQRFYPNAVETRPAVDDCLTLQGRRHGRRGKFHRQSATDLPFAQSLTLPNPSRTSSRFNPNRTPTHSSVSYKPERPCCGIVELLVDDDFGGILPNPQTQGFKVRF
jgi:hypothetical protein